MYDFVRVFELLILVLLIFITLQKPSPALPWDDRVCRISWRGDGQYFVVSAVSPQTGKYTADGC